MRRKILICLSVLAICAGLLYFIFPAPSPVSVHLTDGTDLTLTESDFGPTLVFGGWGWRRFLAKRLNLPLSRFPRGAPQIFRSHFGNGIGFVFTRKLDGTAPNPRIFNGEGSLFLVNEKGYETMADAFSVMFETETINGKDTVVSENIFWEIPNPQQNELHLRIRDTNFNKVSVYDFQVENPAK